MTPKQQKIVDAYIETGSFGAAARLLGKDRSNLRKVIRLLEARGEVPWRSKAPTPNHIEVKNSTVQYNAEGEVVQEWRRQFPSLELLNDVVEGLCERVTGKGKAPKIKRRSREDILFEIDIYDAHVGLYADERETLDENYDCNIASRRMIEATQALADRADSPSKCVLVFGGDMLHVDNRTNQTPSSGHVLDADSRYHRIVDYIISACRDCVDIAARIAPIGS